MDTDGRRVDEVSGSWRLFVVGDYGASTVASTEALFSHTEALLTCWYDTSVQYVQKHCWCDIICLLCGVWGVLH